MPIKRYKYICTRCGSDRIVWDAWACYNPETQQMELENHFDFTFCKECDGECSTAKEYLREE